MPVVKITGQGLSAIALSVALLWSYILAERHVVCQANAGRAEALEQIRRLRRQPGPQPFFMPAPHQNSGPRPALG
jgi:hypothetical protein